MAETHADQEQLDELKKWWSENGSSVIAGIVIGAAGLFGWRGWTTYQHSRAEHASTEYTHLQDAAGKNDRAAAQAYADTLQNDYSKTPYAGLAALEMAKLAVEAGDLDRAVAQLSWAKDHVNQDSVRDVAHLRLARVLISQNKAMDALKLLEEPLPASFGGLIEEARGDAYAALGKTEEARSAYERALAQTQGEAEFLKLKRADLGIVHPAP